MRPPGLRCTTAFDSAPPAHKCTLLSTKMARASIPVTVTTRAGVYVAPTAITQADGGKFANGSDKRVFVRVANTTGGSITLSMVITKTVDGVTPAAKTASIGANAFKVFGPFPTDYNQSDGTVWLNASADGLTVDAYELGT